MPMERKTPIAYPDGVYEIAGFDRPNVLVIANLSQNGLTGRGSAMRTAFFIFFGKFIACSKSPVYTSQIEFLMSCSIHDPPEFDSYAQ